MDKSWIFKARNDKEYIKGAKQWVEWAMSNVGSRDGKILCPCQRCCNLNWMDGEEAHAHILWHGFLNTYVHWHLHGERAAPSDDVENVNLSHDVRANANIQELLHDAFGIGNVRDEGDEVMEEVPADLPRTDANHSREYYTLIEDAEKALYPGCEKFTKLSFIIQLFNIKCLSGWSDKSFDMLLELLKDAFPENVSLPKNFYELKKIIADLGFSYDRIDACPNDCMLFWKQKEKEDTCSICGASRWKKDERNSDDEAKHPSKNKNKVAAKVLRHFPLKQRLQRLFMSSKTATDMRWHEDRRMHPYELRHPSDFAAWQNFDIRHKDFANDPRNVRLGLASDGFNPFRTMSISHSTWPVLLVPYNLPPWKCMKQPYIIMSLLIPGPHGPGMNIDVYLEPLIDELKELWFDGVETYDASKKESFRMHAALLWTISDFSAYAYLSGWSTKGELACPCCNENTCSKWLSHGRKFCYMGHRRFLPYDHRFRYEKLRFNGEQEWRESPQILSGSEILAQLEGITFTTGKRKRGNKITQKATNGGKTGWRKKSIFFELPYWKHLLIRHNLDVMHIEKNVCESIIGTLLSIEGKTKDNLQARRDLEKMGIRPALHPRQSARDRVMLPSACFTMKKEEKYQFCKMLKRVKVPDGYSSNISRCVNLHERKVSGLKSHDCHVLMQQLLSLAIRRVLPHNVVSVLVELSGFFRDICSKKDSEEDFLKLRSRIAIILCHLETIFPPAFFDIMMHLPIHLADEARLAGPVQYRWMYPIERYLLTLKRYVRNRACPEGSIAEGYLADECVSFCSRYLDGVETRMNREKRNDDDGIREMEPDWTIFSGAGRGLGSPVMTHLDNETMEKAHRYVLFNCRAVEPYLQCHREEIRRQQRRATPKDIESIHNKEFAAWFKRYVRNTSEQMNPNFLWLSGGPCPMVKKYQGCTINGVRFHTVTREVRRKTQNSGVSVDAETLSFSSAKDRNPTQGKVTYYGVLTDVIELDYYSFGKIFLFKCDWVNINGRYGVKKDEFGFTLVNLSRVWDTPDPFIFASQAMQVFYVRDPKDKEWHVVRKSTPRDIFELNVRIENEENQHILREDTFLIDEEASWERGDIDGLEMTISNSQGDDDDEEDDISFDNDDNEDDSA